MNAYGNSCPSPYRLHIGAFFGSLHGTLNHLLLTDRLLLQRLTGEGDHPNRLDAILYEGRTELTRACAFRRRRPRCPAHGDHVIRSMTTRAAHELDGAVGCVF